MYTNDEMNEWEAECAYHEAYFESDEYKANIAIERSIERHKRKLYKQWYNSLTPAQREEEDNLKF